MLSPILRQLDLPNTFTLSGLMSSLLAAIFAIQGNFYLAAICLIYSGLTDMLDGVVARSMERTQLQSQVGKQLDSIVDVCSFGFAPAIFAYCYGLQDIFSIILLVFYVAMNALRLSYFGSTGLIEDSQTEYFTGLPVTYAALFITVAFTASVFVSQATMKLILDGVYISLAIAMVANFKMIKIKGIWYGIFALGAIALAVFYGWAIMRV